MVCYGGSSRCCCWWYCRRSGSNAAGTYVSETEFKESEEIDAYAKTVENALWSMGFDVVTLGLASKIKPAYYAAKAKLGSSAEETAKDIIEVLLVLEAKNLCKHHRQFFSKAAQRCYLLRLENQV